MHRQLRRINAKLSPAQTRAFVALFIAEDYGETFGFYELKGLFDRTEKYRADQRICQLTTPSPAKPLSSTAPTAATCHDSRPDILNFFTQLEQIEYLKHSLIEHEDFTLPDAFRTFDLQGKACLERIDLEAALTAIAVDLPTHELDALFNWLRGDEPTVSYERFVQVLLPKSTRHQEALLYRGPKLSTLQGFNAFSRATKRLFRSLLEALARASVARGPVRESILTQSREELAEEFLQLLAHDELV